jgi:hypothetical protein
MKGKLNTFRSGADDAPVGVERFAVQTHDPELVSELISEIYGVHRAQLGGSRERFRVSPSSVVVGSNLRWARPRKGATQR